MKKSSEKPKRKGFAKVSQAAKQKRMKEEQDAREKLQ